MQIRFLLGPAGSGKTWRCLQEMRSSLLASPEGLPLICLAPKQATFQLERQLLSDPTLPGYTRLRVVSFERLAEFVLAFLKIPPPRLVDEEGRVMVLRALLEEKREQLKVFRASARMPGFAQELSLLLREFQQYRHSQRQLESLSSRLQNRRPLAEKLQDLALLLGAYQEWLAEHDLQDQDALLDLAIDGLRAQADEGERPIKFGGLWLDGFAELTPQELELVATLAPISQLTVLAFCLDAEPQQQPQWLSTWALVSQTYRKCFQRLAALPASSIAVDVLPRDAGRGRFADAPTLQQLERAWAQGSGASAAGLSLQPNPKGDLPIRVVRCASLEMEALFAAREILRFVRGGGRYREIAILVRKLDDYQYPLRHMLQRYGIPFFLDRREPVAHHPLAELTRYALRCVAFGWKHDDWFGALKSGLAPAEETELDWLENEALARGWQGEVWFQPLPKVEQVERLDQLRRKVIPPFEEFRSQVCASAQEGAPVSGTQLAAAVRRLWAALTVPQQLDAWSEGDGSASESGWEAAAFSRLHSGIWEQMQNWLDNLALAFPRQSMPLTDWLALVETGLAGLTIGVIPPALDQVLIGAIDRSRNPDLRVALVLGLNESIFPAAPPTRVLLTEAERLELEQHQALLAENGRLRLGHERYFGYIALTRARERLVLTCASSDANDRALNPSPFIFELQRIFPNLAIEHFAPSGDWLQAQHPVDLLGALVQNRTQPLTNQVQALNDLEDAPPFSPLRQRLQTLAEWSPAPILSAATAEKLYGPILRTSVSRLEEFAACPFRFFVSSGLKAEERKRFELDRREQGSFQHQVLARFHQSLRAENKGWRDLNPAEGRARIAQIAAEVESEFEGGLLRAGPQQRFAARHLTEALQNCVATLIEWMSQYDFEPEAAELEFGTEGAPLPGWQIDLKAGRHLLFRGKIDRVDLCRSAGKDEALFVVIDYKSRAQGIDSLLLETGVQMQLPAYAALLAGLDDPRPVFGVSRLIPAGLFYINLSGRYQSASNRGEVLPNIGVARHKAYQHCGWFDLSALSRLDTRPEARAGNQFNYRLTKEGKLYRSSREGIEPIVFKRLLAQIPETVAEMGRAIYAGVVRIDPYQHSGKRACEQCDYQTICRIDRWTHRFRPLVQADHEHSEVPS